MGKSSGKREDVKEVLKRMIKRLHEDEDPEKVKEGFKEVLRDATPTVISQIEEELIEEGMPREEVQRLCDVHLAVFKESLEKAKPMVPPGHPIQILSEEHRILLNFADELKNIAERTKEAGDFDSADEEMKELVRLTKGFKESESHYLREENVLFPYLEKHGVKQPPAIMWTEHDRIREIEKSLYRLSDRENMAFQAFTKRLEEVALSLADMLSSHFYKENNILFPTALDVIGEGEWKDVRQQFDELGYCSFTPESARITVEETKGLVPKREIEGTIPFETGNLPKDGIEAIFNTLPVDITFVDEEDTVRYFSRSKDRIFARTKAIIGRKVQQCHPQKSVHIVEKILKAFKSGRKDVAEFWLNLKGRLIHIRYFAVRDEKGEYLGCLEVTQDITDIKKIEGERRLLEWED